MPGGYGPVIICITARSIVKSWLRNYPEKKNASNNQKLFHCGYDMKQARPTVTVDCVSDNKRSYFWKMSREQIGYRPPRRPWCFLNQTCLGAHRHLLRDFPDTEHCWWQKVTLDSIPHDTVTPLNQMVCQRVSSPNWCLYFYRSAHWGQGPLPFTLQKPLSSSCLLGDNCILSILNDFFHCVWALSFYVAFQKELQKSQQGVVLHIKSSFNWHQVWTPAICV